MKNSRVLAGLVALFTVLTALAVVPVAHAKAAADQPNVLYLAMQQDMPDFNTWNLASNGVWKSYVINWGFEGLVGLDYDMLPFGVLAQTWEFNETTLTWTFHLRHGVTFQDRTPFTADDVMFIYTAARSGTAYSANLINAFDANADGVANLTEMNNALTKVDDYTVTMKMATAYGLFLTTTAGIPIMPKAIWQNHLKSDGTLDVLWGSDPKATISTGPWMYKEGISNTYRIMEKYTGYWGKNATTPLGYKMYAPHIDQLYYKIYASIDTAILALQSGAVDYITWPVTAGRVPSLQADPNIKMSYLSDNGYFYLAFNEKFDPMGNVSFRRAISHLIDKDQIVNVYMGGFGTKGSASEPPFWGDWYNSTVNTWPYDATLATSKSILDAAGYSDVNGDGWRELPGGAPMQKITILTPPADYDPVRIRAGQMIAKNMRDVGINAEAKAIDFDTLVTRLQGMDYQMLIIGWSLSAEPVGNVFDILGPLANQNTFGFWSDAQPNPYYKDLLGVNTRADPATQSAADFVTYLANKARAQFNVTKQILYTKWAEGVLASFLPVNVLYYRVNIYATRTTWTGWLPYLGDLFGPGVNLFSLSNLKKTGAGGGAAVGATASVNAGLSLPGKVLSGEVADAYVSAIDNVGAPVSGATVSVAVAGVTGAATVTPGAVSGTTDATGTWKFNLTGGATGFSYVNITASKGGVTSAQSGTVRVVTALPTSLAMKVKVDKLVLDPSAYAHVTITVTDQNGKPVSGANVTIDPNLVSYGTVNRTYGLTNAKGVVLWNYTAPDATTVAHYLNSHLTVTLSYAVSKTGYAWAAAAAANLLIFNAAAPDWVMAQIVDLTSKAPTRAANTTTVTVNATDDQGNLLAGMDLKIEYSNSSLVFNPVTLVTTDLSGEASFDVQFKDMTDSAALRIKVYNATMINSVAATLTLPYLGSATPVPTMYGGYMSWDLPAPYMDPMGAITATAHIWDQNGVDADGINASLVVSGTSYGSLVWCDAINWDSVYDDLSINAVTANDGNNMVTSGPFNTFFNFTSWESQYNNMLYWNWTDDTLPGNPQVMTGVDVTAGTLDVAVYGVDVAPVDLIGHIIVVPGGEGSYNAHTLEYQIDGATTISADYVVGRAYHVAAANMAISKPVMTAKASSFDSSTVSVTVTDETNSPLEGAGTTVYQNSLKGNLDYMIVPYASASSRWSSKSVSADANGVGVSTLITIAKNNVVTQAGLVADVYAKATMDGYVSLFAQGQVIIHVAQAFISIDPIYDVQNIGDMLLVKATVMDASGSPIKGLPVELSVGGGATVASPTLGSDANGEALFEVDTSQITNARAAFVPIQAKAAGPGWEVALATIMVPVKNDGPAISVLSPKAGTDVTRTNVTLLGSASDSNGIQTVKYSIDGGSMVTLAGTGGATVWDVSASLGKLSKGDHTLVVNATDSIGVSSEVTVTFGAINEKAKTDMVAWGVAIVGWVIAALVVVMMLLRKPKAMAPEMAKPEEEPKM
jgi:ABC-type transport system substrate-binding protein/protocatechuate 3,4-dioxygenase beta subunit